MQWYLSSRGVYISVDGRFAIHRETPNYPWTLIDRNEERGTFDSVIEAQRAAERIASQGTAALVEARR